MQLAQMLIPAVSAFAITVILLPLFIGFMRMNHEGQTIRDEGPKWHAKKNGTPTMGGVVFILAIVVSAIWVAAWTHQLTMTVWVALFILVLYGVLGFVDDFVKVVNHRNLGLRAWQKLLGQLVGAAVFLVVFLHEGFAPVITVPFIGPVNSVLLYTLFAAFWMVGFSNAVNLTDGLDGLVAGQGTVAFGTYAFIAAHDHRTDVLIICLVTVGALLGFLLYNHKPAKIFMGDVGSLALGGMLAVVALMLHREWSLLLIGIIFVCETASVILQVLSFKLTGKRIFKMSPIHHHFEMSGWSEWRIDITFWIVGAVASGLYLAFAL
ncbi:phospho-N-acetylmuramoyl-pentapeptide-transferase [Lacticaseibacillus pantheris]|jgi:phospho-N-acetylmuramoyl-pentapeptide-transferase|uniref:Phospho-N-acetylmuramoyl-pentapeptide-transferase n=1 Tax=Lacticaseibacillus pantheris DSM 15945 = JCM 12539 = NBRC 106106 TaxID=1423783 RepID=A0A0R1U0P4_9LACO|nr:phospho-N-acetylmuramoyl-pentapeptide-transferase [Lacticaseibacillus pantheris]KRL84450.1 phospho-N-acetylmuramoyl-pentapeptide-transferase [Lacticaseibacillus pantheris DSM 15945 = JCM 12539 = NBRC 106106]WKF84866.1 phospho-N-acetylmuramoyl-pentapeptide-transferase [Lacticaseibacillus pantheris]